MHKLLLASCALLAGTPSFAQGPGPCAQAENTIEIMQCLDKVYKSKDGALNEAYQALLKTLAPSMTGDTTDYAAVKRELADAQRAWIRFRDSDCKARYKFWEQGSVRGIKYVSCLIGHTERRTADLAKWADI